VPQQLHTACRPLGAVCTMSDWDQPNPVKREDIRRSIREHRKVLNRLEPHLGCVVCRGPLTEGVCPTCDPAEKGM
jgi:hypothetical protein